jgi:hypothetical protein
VSRAGSGHVAGLGLRQFVLGRGRRLGIVGVGFGFRRIGLELGIDVRRRPGCWDKQLRRRLRHKLGQQFDQQQLQQQFDQQQLRQQFVKQLRQQFGKEFQR